MKIQFKKQTKNIAQFTDQPRDFLLITEQYTMESFMCTVTLLLVNAVIMRNLNM